MLLFSQILKYIWQSYKFDKNKISFDLFFPQTKESFIIYLINQIKLPKRKET